MFGCCVAGRLLQTNLTQVDDTHAYFELPNAGTINHLCVFLMGSVPFPEGYGATVHFLWPEKGTYSGVTTSAAQDRFSSFSTPAMEQDVTAILGLAIEPLNLIQAQVQTIQGSLVAADMLRDPTVLAERIVKNLFNYISGFTGGPLNPNVAIPMNLIMRWYENFLGKVRAGGVGFLERGD
ncbi:DUF775-domain-containing protein [Flammula alnicola]|nr:DUF775-domain-containing protein [Flammula alnicola]